ncbi:MAG TPA: hypothetical protein VGP99_05615 [Tepidisphaeraceae bacterium]|jgi:hypothetical protein|nr:hypothetical protein [Tepidisphaeraceae bacterium]
MEMTETQFDSDQFLKLLTEALRAGPGSPQWHEAVNQLKNSSVADADEYRMLINAREHLESGRDYRSIRAGPGFARKVMTAIDEEAAAQAPAPPSASIIAIVAAAGIIAIVTIVAIIWYRGGPPQPSPTDLANIVFAQTTISTDFTQTQTIPPEWRTFGLAPVIASRSRGLGAPQVKSGQNDDKDYRGGGIYAASGIAPTQTFAFEAAIRQYKASENVAVQIFITDTPDFDKNPKASSPHELVCYVLNGTISIAKPDGSIQGTGAKAKDLNHIQIKLDKQYVLIENDGQTLYSGTHDLAPDKARYAGVRFLVKPSDKPLEDLTVPSVRILKP